MRDQPLVGKPLRDDEQPCCAFGQQAPSPTPHPHGVLADRPQVRSLSCANYRPLSGIASTPQAVQAETGSGIVCLSTNGQPAAWLHVLLMRTALVVTAGASLLPLCLVSARPYHICTQQISMGSSSMVPAVAKCWWRSSSALVRMGVLHPLSPAQPFPCSIAVALGSSRWRWEEQSRRVLHIRSMANGFAIFMDFVFFLTKAKTTKNVITLPCCCYKQS